MIQGKKKSISEEKDKKQEKTKIKTYTLSPYQAKFKLLSNKIINF